MQSAQFGWDLGNMQMSSLGKGFVCCLFVWVGRTLVMCNPPSLVPRWTNRFGDRYTAEEYVSVFVFVCLNTRVIVDMRDSDGQCTAGLGSLSKKKSQG